MASNITKRGDKYYFRARIPTELIAAYGRAMVSVSLQTEDKEVARARARDHRSQLERELESLRPAAAASVGPPASITKLHLSDAEIERVCERFRTMMLATDERDRIDGISPSMLALDTEIFETGLPDLRRAYARGDLSHVHTSLREHLQRIGLSVGRQTPAYERLARQFQRTEIEVYDALLKRRQGIAVEVPTPAAADELTVMDVFACWKRQRSENAKTVRAFELAFEALAAALPGKSATALRKADVVDFRNALMAGDKIGRATIAKHIGFLRAAFQIAVDDDLLDLNPFVGVKVAAPKSTVRRKTRLPFNVEELNAIFAGPIYKAGFKPRPSLGAACHWLPLMALFSGARLEELAQLRVDDVIEHPTLGHYLRVRTHEEAGQKVKNLNSERNVPVHPMLVELGFLTYVHQQAGRLFPALKPDKYGILSTTFSTYFGRYLNEVGVSDPTRVFHSFRHAFIDECKLRALLIPAEVREAIVGHLRAAQIEMVYGSGRYPLEPQAAAMKEVCFQGLDLSAVPRWT